MAETQRGVIFMWIIGILVSLMLAMNSWSAYQVTVAQKCVADLAIKNDIAFSVITGELKTLPDKYVRIQRYEADEIVRRSTSTMFANNQVETNRLLNNILLGMATGKFLNKDNKHISD